MLIGLSGKAGAGKDAIAEVLVREHGFVRKAFAAKMKEAALALDPFVAAQFDSEDGLMLLRLSHLIAKVGPEKAKEHPEVRRLYQRMGTEVGREILDPSIWINLLFLDYGMATWPDNVVISDVRFINEMFSISSHGGYTWRIIRQKAGLVGETAQHRSEVELPEQEEGYYDYVIYNDGTLEDLATKIDRALQVIRSS